MESIVWNVQSRHEFQSDRRTGLIVYEHFFSTQQVESRFTFLPIEWESPNVSHIQTTLTRHTSLRTLQGKPSPVSMLIVHPLPVYDLPAAVTSFLPRLNVWYQHIL